LVIRVQTRDNEPVDKALRRLRKLCNNEGLTRISKAKAYFEKPSERRRREARERLKAIRLSRRAKVADAQKLASRRRKARKVARAQGGPGDAGERAGRRPSEGPTRKPENERHPPREPATSASTSSSAPSETPAND
jgi:small subunit ribosomal protein S21